MIKEMKFNESILVFLGDLRIRRNGSFHDWERFEDSYLENNCDKLEFIIEKIEMFLDQKN